jgi:hypothetical protein
LIYKNAVPLELKLKKVFMPLSSGGAVFL